MNGSEIIKKFHSALPGVTKWIEDLLAAHQAEATAVGSHGFTRLRHYFPDKILQETKVVIVAAVPFPPLSHFGLEEFSAMEHMPLAGITYNDTFFVHERCKTESLFFHELVHVVQWARLGTENFLLVYGVGIIQFGYEYSPFEQMAYSLQRNFDRGNVPEKLFELIQQETDAIWRQVAPVVGK